MKKIVFVLSLLALTGSVVTSCSKDREEVATQKEDRAITKENLEASGKFVITHWTSFDENGKVIKTETPGSGDVLGSYGGFIFKKDGTFASFYQPKSTDKIEETKGKYELEGNKLTLKSDDKNDKDEIYEIVEFVKGKYLKLKIYNIKKDDSGKEQKLVEIFEFEVKP